MSPRAVRAIRIGAMGGIALLAGIQLVPYGREKIPPPITSEPAWDSPGTRELAVRACFNCHSSETKWPWYASIAPVSWLVRDHVDEGRAALDFSTWDHPGAEAMEAGEVVREGEMPPAWYPTLHPEARLTPAELDALAAGLEATVHP